MRKFVFFILLVGVSLVAVGQGVDSTHRPTILRRSDVVLNPNYNPKADMYMHLRVAGSTGVASVFLMAIGGAMIGTGLVTQKNEITYVGAGFTGLSLFPLVIAFVQLSKAGNSFYFMDRNDSKYSHPYNPK